MARLQQKKQAAVTTGTPKHAGLPCAIGFNGLCRTLPGVPGLLAPVAFRIISAEDLTPASGRQDHAV